MFCPFSSKKMMVLLYCFTFLRRSTFVIVVPRVMTSRPALHTSLVLQLANKESGEERGGRGGEGRRGEGRGGEGRGGEGRGGEGRGGQIHTLYSN